MLTDSVGINRLNFDKAPCIMLLSRFGQFTLLALLVVATISGCTSQKPDQAPAKIDSPPAKNAADLKVAMVLPGKITDRSWNQAGFEGLKRIESDLKLEVAYSEQVAQPDQVEALSDYARRGFQVVIGHGGEFQDSVNQAAEHQKNTLFFVNNGTKSGGNVGTIGFQFRQPGFVVGYIAAKSSKTGKLGFIGGQKISAYEQLASGFEAGAKSANPDATVSVVWTNDWDDVAKGKEAALSLISEGVDVVFPTMDNATVGSLQAAKEKKVLAIGIYYDAIKDWPDTVIQSAIIDIRGAMVETLKKVQSGSKDGAEYRYGFDTPVALRLGNYHESVPAEVRDAVEAIITKIKSKELTP